MKARIFAPMAVLAVALVPTAHGTARTHAGPLTTAPTVFVDIRVTITDTRIRLSRYHANRGDEGRFIITNVGTKRHTFAFGGSTTRGVGKQTGFTATLKPKEQKILLLFLDYRGPLQYRSITPADLTKPGMKGIFKIL